ncbi:MAG: hypothetical protein EPO16_12705 [Dehalococcoidia bacterium]|nr:MAG: hypothetical protein EPO16_12705 [Dehalococcoidia bacterium]
MNADAATVDRTRNDGRMDERVLPIVEKKDIWQEVDEIKCDLAVQAATQTGALATQAAMQAGALATATAVNTGAEATLAATQAGAAATLAAAQAGQAAATSAAIMGLWSTLVGSMVALVAGIFLGSFFQHR